MRLLLWLMFSLQLLNPDLPAYRKLLAKSMESQAVAKHFYEQLKHAKTDGDPVILGFRAMSEMMLCKHMLNPISRIGHFNKGRDLLELAIKTKPGSPELLFFRLNTQVNVPTVLGYRGNLASDKAELIKYLKKGTDESDANLYKIIKNYLAQSSYCTAEERAMIKSL